MVPEHYARDITFRCATLLETLLPIVESRPGPQFGGPLTTTLLLALSTPMVVLPYERIYQPARGRAQVGDERQLDPGLASAVLDVMGKGRPFGEAPFGRDMTWRYCPNRGPFNIADPWNRDLLGELASDEAADRARRIDAFQMITDLRNGLAHGGVIYLDEAGAQTAGQARFLAFAGAVKRGPKLVALNIVRIDEREYRQFLSLWSDWLVNTRVAAALNSSVEAA